MSLITNHAVPGVIYAAHFAAQYWYDTLERQNDYASHGAFQPADWPVAVEPSLVTETEIVKLTKYVEHIAYETLTETIDRCRATGLNELPGVKFVDAITSSMHFYPSAVQEAVPDAWAFLGWVLIPLTLLMCFASICGCCWEMNTRPANDSPPGSPNGDSGGESDDGGDEEEGGGSSGGEGDSGDAGDDEPPEDGSAEESDDGDEDEDGGRSSGSGSDHGDDGDDGPVEDDSAEESGDSDGDDLSAPEVPDQDATMIETLEEAIRNLQQRLETSNQRAADAMTEDRQLQTDNGNLQTENEKLADDIKKLKSNGKKPEAVNTTPDTTAAIEQSGVDPCAKVRKELQEWKSKYNELLTRQSPRAPSLPHVEGLPQDHKAAGTEIRRPQGLLAEAEGAAQAAYDEVNRLHTLLADTEDSLQQAIDEPEARITARDAEIARLGTLLRDTEGSLKQALGEGRAVLEQEIARLTTELANANDLAAAGWAAASPSRKSESQGNQGGGVQPVAGGDAKKAEREETIRNEGRDEVSAYFREMEKNLKAEVNETNAQMTALEDELQRLKDKLAARRKNNQADPDSGDELFDTLQPSDPNKTLSSGSKKSGPALGNGLAFGNGLGFGKKGREDKIKATGIPTNEDPCKDVKAKLAAAEKQVESLNAELKALKIRLEAPAGKKILEDRGMQTNGDPCEDVKVKLTAAEDQLKSWAAELKALKTRLEAAAEAKRLQIAEDAKDAEEAKAREKRARWKEQEERGRQAQEEKKVQEEKRKTEREARAKEIARDKENRKLAADLKAAQSELKILRDQAAATRKRDDDPCAEVRKELDMARTDLQTAETEAETARSEAETAKNEAETAKSEAETAKTALKEAEAALEKGRTEKEEQSKIDPCKDVKDELEKAKKDAAALREKQKKREEDLKAKEEALKKSEEKVKELNEKLKAADEARTMAVKKGEDAQTQLNLAAARRNKALLEKETKGQKGGQKQAKETQTQALSDDNVPPQHRASHPPERSAESTDVPSSTPSANVPNGPAAADSEDSVEALETKLKLLNNARPGILRERVILSKVEKDIAPAEKERREQALEAKTKESDENNAEINRVKEALSKAQALAEAGRRKTLVPVGRTKKTDGTVASSQSAAAGSSTARKEFGTREQSANSASLGNPSGENSGSGDPSGGEDKNRHRDGSEQNPVQIPDEPSSSDSSSSSEDDSPDDGESPDDGDDMAQLLANQKAATEEMAELLKKYEAAKTAYANQTPLPPMTEEQRIAENERSLPRRRQQLKENNRLSDLAQQSREMLQSLGMDFDVGGELPAHLPESVLFHGGSNTWMDPIPPSHTSGESSSSRSQSFSGPGSTGRSIFPPDRRQSHPSGPPPGVPTGPRDPDISRRPNPGSQRPGSDRLQRDLFETRKDWKHPDRMTEAEKRAAEKTRAEKTKAEKTKAEKTTAEKHEEQLALLTKSGAVNIIRRDMKAQTTPATPSSTVEHPQNTQPHAPADAPPAMPSAATVPSAPIGTANLRAQATQFVPARRVHGLSDSMHADHREDPREEEMPVADADADTGEDAEMGMADADADAFRRAESPVAEHERGVRRGRGSSRGRSGSGSGRGGISGARRNPRESKSSRGKRT